MGRGHRILTPTKALLLFGPPTSVQNFICLRRPTYMLMNITWLSWARVRSYKCFSVFAYRVRALSPAKPTMWYAGLLFVVAHNQCRSSVAILWRWAMAVKMVRQLAQFADFFYGDLGLKRRLLKVWLKQSLMQHLALQNSCWMMNDVVFI